MCMMWICGKQTSQFSGVALNGYGDDAMFQPLNSETFPLKLREARFMCCQGATYNRGRAYRSVY